MEKKHNPFTMHVNVDDFIPATEEERFKSGNKISIDCSHSYNSFTTSNIS